MIKNVLVHINDIEVFPIISLVLFVLVFAGSIIRAASLKKSEAAAYGRMPLEDSKEGEFNHE